MNIKAGDFVVINRDIRYKDRDRKMKVCKSGSVHKVISVQNRGFVLTDYTGFFQDEYDLYNPDLENK